MTYKARKLTALFTRKTFLSLQNLKTDLLNNHTTYLDLKSWIWGKWVHLIISPNVIVINLTLPGNLRSCLKNAWPRDYLIKWNNVKFIGKKDSNGVALYKVPHVRVSISAIIFACCTLLYSCKWINLK